MSASRGVESVLPFGLICFAALAATPLRADETAIERALAQKVSLDFRATPLSIAAASLGQLLRVPVRIDPEAFDDKERSSDQAVTLQVRGISGESALNLLVLGVRVKPPEQRADGLGWDYGGQPTWTVRDNSLCITSDERAWYMLSTRVYDVTDLLPPEESHNAQVAAVYDLVVAISVLVEPDSWEETGAGKGTVKALSSGPRTTLVVNQTWRFHREIERLLATLRTMRNSQPVGGARATCPRPDAAEERFRRALAGPVSIEFDKKPLVEVAQYLEERLKVPVVLDHPALQSMQIDPATTLVTMGLKDISPASALNLLLNGEGLTWVYRNDVLLITTPDVANEALLVRVVDVSDLVSSGSRPSDPPDFAPLIDMVENTVDPDSWADTGAGKGQIAPLDLGPVRVLAVSNTRPVHNVIEKLLANIRALRHASIVDREFSVKFVPLDPAAERVCRALAQKVDMDLDKVPLVEAIAKLHESMGITILLDSKALDGMSISPDTPVSLHLSGVSFSSGLKVLLNRLGLTYMYQNEVLYITTPDVANEALIARVYDVSDLRGPLLRQPAVPSPFGRGQGEGGRPPTGSGLFAVPPEPCQTAWDSGSTCEGRAKSGCTAGPSPILAQRAGGGGGRVGWTWPRPLGASNDIDFDALIDAMENCIDPDSWVDTGAGQGSIQQVEADGIRALVVSNTGEVHHKVEAFFRDLRAMRRPGGTGPHPDPLPRGEGTLGGMPSRSVGMPWPRHGDGDDAMPPDAVMRAALAKTVTLEFHETPLEEVARSVTATAGIAVVLDEGALEGMSVPLDVPVTFQHCPMPLHTALDLMLRPLDLAWTVDGEVLLITSPDVANEVLATKFYDVSDLISKANPSDESQWPNFDPLIDALENCIDSDSWVDTGAGQGSIQQLSIRGLDVLVVSTTWNIHREVESLLGDLRAVSRRPVPGIVFGQKRPRAGDRYQPMRRALATPVYVNLDHATVPEAAQFFEKALGVPVALDKKVSDNVLDKITVPPDAPVTLHQMFFRAPVALDAAFAQAKLTWAPHGGVIWITTPDAEANFLEAEVFDLHGLPGSCYERGSKPGDSRGLTDKIEGEIETDSWADTGAGQGKIDLLQADGLAALCVANTWKIRRRVEAMLQGMAPSPR